MIDLRCKYLSVRCIWQYLIIMSRRTFKENPHSIVWVNVREFLARRRDHVWISKESNEFLTHNHFVRKGTINHLAKLAKWLTYVWVLICRVYLTVCYCHVTNEFETESTNYSLIECQGTPYSKEAPYMIFKWQQRDSNPQPNSM